MWDKIWRDADGEVVLWQRPNVWLIGWVVLIVISLFFSGNSQTADVLSLIGTVLLGIWAVLEVLKGVNYFRRALGLIVLVPVILSLIRFL